MGRGRLLRQRLCQGHGRDLRHRSPVRDRIAKLETDIALNQAKNKQVLEETRPLQAQLEAMEKFRENPITHGKFTDLTAKGIRDWLETVDPAQRNVAVQLLDNELDAQLRREDISTTRWVELKAALVRVSAGDEVPEAPKK